MDLPENQWIVDPVIKAIINIGIVLLIVDMKILVFWVGALKIIRAGLKNYGWTLLIPLYTFLK